MNPIQEKIDVFQQVLAAIPELCYAGNPVLRQVAVPVSVEEGMIIGKKLGEVLIRYRAITGYGRGLAASQIGEGKAVFSTYVDDKVEMFINPIIVEKSKETSFYRELCMSSAIMSADVERPDWIEMEWVDEKAEKRRERIEGLKARLYQHEEAHLRGFLNLDEAIKGSIEFITLDPLKEQLRKTR